MCLLNATGAGNFSIWNSLNDTGLWIRRFYAGAPANNVTVIRNSDSSPLYFTQPIRVNIAALAVILVLQQYLQLIYHVFMLVLIMLGLETQQLIGIVIVQHIILAV